MSLPEASQFTWGCDQPATGWSQPQVNWEGCGMKGICKILRWDVGFSRSALCDCCKPVSGHRVRGESGRDPATDQGPLKCRNGTSSPGLYLKRGHKCLLLLLLYSSVFLLTSNCMPCCLHFLTFLCRGLHVVVCSPS